MTIEDLSARLETMERAHRRMRAAVAVLALLAVAAGTMGQVSGLPKVVKAEEFQVVDAKGECRGVFHSTAEEVGLKLLAKDGKTEAYLRLPSTGGAEMALSDSKGTTRVWHYVTPDGNCGSSLFRVEATPAAVLHVGKSSTVLKLFAVESDPSASVEVSVDGGARLGITDKDGKVIERLPK